MKNLLQYLEKNNIQYETRKTGRNYFTNTPGPRAVMVYIEFPFYDGKIQARKSVKDREKVERYCKRYGYTIFNTKSYYDIGITYFSVMKNSDLEKLNDYETFVNAAVQECEKAIHAGKDNKTLSYIMKTYEINYRVFLNAINAA